MSNREIVVSLYEAFSRREFAKVTSLTSSDLVVIQSDILPWGGTYVGHIGLQQFAARLYEIVDSQVTIEEYIEAGGHVVAIGWTKGMIRQTAVPFSIRIAHVWTIQEGKAVKFEPFIDTPGMLRALDL